VKAGGERALASEQACAEESRIFVVIKFIYIFLNRPEVFQLVAPW